MRLVRPNPPENAEVPANESTLELDINVKLLHVCKMVYEEELSILYQNNTFFIMGSAKRFGDLSRIVSGGARDSFSFKRLHTAMGR